MSTVADRYCERPSNILAHVKSEERCHDTRGQIYGHLVIQNSFLEFVCGTRIIHDIGNFLKGCYISLLRPVARVQPECTRCRRR